MGLLVQIVAWMRLSVLSPKAGEEGLSPNFGGVENRSLKWFIKKNHVTVLTVYRKIPGVLNIAGNTSVIFTDNCRNQQQRRYASSRSPRRTIDEWLDKESRLDGTAFGIEGKQFFMLVVG